MAGIKVVAPTDDIILITSEGVIIRLDTEDISTYGRVTKGVRLMRLAEGVSLVSVARVEKEDHEEEVIDSDTGENDTTISTEEAAPVTEA